MRRVVISGLGSISPHGVGTQPFWNGLLEGKSSLAKLARFNPDAFPSHVAGEIPPFKTTDYVPKSYRKATKIMARDIELAVVAADQAIRDARLISKGLLEATPQEKLAADGWFKFDPARMGCNIGAGLICADLDELTAAMAQCRGPNNTLDLARWGRSDDPTKTSGMENLTPLWLLKYLPNMLACHVSIIHDTQGPSNTITCSQASAGLALSEAARTIQRGHADMALVGGCESKINPMAIMRLCLLHRLTTTFNDNPAAACRPYDKDASGAVLAEGGAVLVIEEYEHAKKRGATIYAEVVGLASSASASTEIIEPDPTGEAPAVALKKAMKNAGIEANKIDLVVPPGTALPRWDKADAKAFNAVFANTNAVIAPSRGGIGDCGAGSMALDLVAAALALKHQTIYPAVNVKDPIDNLRINLEKTSRPLEYAVVLATAMGGQNSAVVLKKVS
jgi:3-oxoacyl-[acyl-carrier-protein] synthase II